MTAAPLLSWPWAAIASVDWANIFPLFRDADRKKQSDVPLERTV
jgi:hypothetical protein